MRWPLVRDSLPVRLASAPLLSFFANFLCVYLITHSAGAETGNIYVANVSFDVRRGFVHPRLPL